MRFLHTMVRVRDLDESLKFYVNVLGLHEVDRMVNEAGRFTLVFLATPNVAAPIVAGQAAKGRQSPVLELTYNWDTAAYAGGRNFGHLAYEVDDIYAFCRHLIDKEIVINRPPRDGNMAFIKSPDGISIEILQKGSPLPAEEPWISMKNQGSW